MNLAYKFPIIYWNCANLIVNAGGENDGGQTDYNKIAKALSKILNEGIKLSLIDINKSDKGFKPNVEDNTILYGLKAVLKVGDELIEETIKNRPYSSPKDYLNRVKPNKQAMISLIQGGAFDNLMDRKLCMGWYIWETCDKKKRLTLQNLPGLIRYNMLPEETEEQVNARRIYEFNRYLKAVCKNKNDSNFYYLDERAMDFLIEMGYDDLIISKNNNESYIISVKGWDKKYQIWMDVFRNWITEDKETILQSLNEKIFLEDWNKYALGNLSSWEMNSLCFYYHEHELAHINNNRYGFVNYFNLSENPIVDRSFTKGGKTINIFKLSKICGTCIAKDKAKSTVSLLTPYGVVDVKFNKEYFTMFDKRISEKNPDGTKSVKENSWFNKGSMIVVQGMRSGDNFVSKNYKSLNSHQLYKIDKINDDGSLLLRHERYKGEEEEDYD